MATSTTSSLADQQEIPYLDDQGLLPHQFEGAIGAYAILNASHQIVHTGYSRNILLSLKQHLIRNPEACHGVKVMTVERPSKRVLEDMIHRWHQELGVSPYSQDNPESRWTESIQILPLMSPEDRSVYEQPQIEHRAKIKLLKQTARNMESKILLQLESRGCQEQFRFNPKLKEQGILDLK